MNTDRIDEIDEICVSQNKIVLVRVRTAIADGETLKISLHRKSIVPGADFSQEHQSVQEVCSIVHTEQAIENYKIAAARGA